MQQARTSSWPSNQASIPFPGAFVLRPPVANEEKVGEGRSEPIVSCRSEERCQPHRFSPNASGEETIGEGTYGMVFKVKCTLCHQEYAKKVFKPQRNMGPAIWEKHIRSMHMELRCYATLNHPNILSYVQYEHSCTTMQIYTEFCEGGDLQEFLEIKKPEELNLESLTWIILEGLASALARCHHGLKTTSEFDTVYHYTGFEKDWRPILHRDIKPANILVAIKDKALIPKLGDFGTSFRLEENGKPPSTVAGTRLYWAPV
ncbi:hypothetical protein ANO14919_079400 [Xylariales sp. No.14919]|nr:hypothetical protein ANO14919_079400 [Xylariales sp. No.14919]